MSYSRKESMTAIAIWLNEEQPGNPSIWVAGDSQVSKSNHGVALIDDAVKVAALTIICRKPNATGFFADLLYANTVGYAFAGSTLLGHNIYLALAPLLCNINVVDGITPSLEDVALYVKAYFQSSLETYVLNTQRPSIEIAIFGYCPVKDALETYCLRLLPGSHGAEVHCDQMPRGEVTYLGTGSEKIQSALNDSLIAPVDASRDYRAPASVIRSLILNENFPGIGGDIQLGYASKQGFTPMALCKPYVPGNPKSFISYLGRPLQREIGSAIIGIPAMASTFCV